MTGESGQVAKTNEASHAQTSKSGERPSKASRPSRPRPPRARVAEEAASPGGGRGHDFHIAAHIWAAALLIVDVVFLVRYPSPTQFQWSGVTFLFALTGGAFYIALLKGRFRLDGNLLGVVVSAGGGAGVFILSLLFLLGPTARTQITQSAEAKSGSPGLSVPSVAGPTQSKVTTTPARRKSPVAPGHDAHRGNLKSPSSHTDAMPGLTGSTRDFHIEAGNSTLTLSEFAEQAEQSLMYDYAAMRGIRTEAVYGRMTSEEALRRMLGDSGVSFARINGHMMALMTPLSAAERTAGRDNHRPDALAVP